eukprot:3951709-Amphidinium_carterae.2
MPPLQSRHVGKCVDSVLSRLSVVLYPQLVHLALSVPALRIASKRTMTCTQTCVLLAQLWLMLLVFGRDLPLVAVLSLVAAKVHALLLSGSWGIMSLDTSDDSLAHVPRTGLGFAISLAVILQHSSTT